MKRNAVFQDILRYFSGEDVDFSGYEPDLSDLTEFQQEVLTEVRKIPYGQTVTYAELACRIGKEGAARAVGSALAKNPYPIIIPCHRVVSSSGIGGFCGETCGEKTELKKKMLDMESRVSSGRE
ncbi:methylated-DNA--[protein]-cysteine S-methyltransferase [Methanolobus chelungpuianus]|uniref:methylated-DNA--[protein]-cysteine S-methyltransferase n=1 Tax=Methanolobus chelungpuianus TaxID=502115 RepID=A0AAE3H8L5_9EURY|nr:methylated-DNA--[protein]-cysteine S-methyltransferase [Methanolobus chelungpuianus]MCQ6961689.1 cysteine methyltransferase [Methanolobus chelungpuianus]